MIKSTITSIGVGDEVLSPFGKSYQVVGRETPAGGCAVAIAQAVGGKHQVRLDDRKIANGSWIVFGERVA